MYVSQFWSLPMSFIEKNNLNYLSKVEQFFLSLKKSGLALSAADYHLINKWEERGIPVELLCRAIERGFVQHRRFSRAPKVSLTYFQNIIEEEIQKSTP